MTVIQVEYEVYSTRFHINKIFKELEKYSVLSFDTETRGVYSKRDREHAVQMLKNPHLVVEDKRECLLVSNNSGLSYPALVSVTHFVFGLSNDRSIIFICDDPMLEIHIWNWVASYKGKLIVHNTLFDLKIMYNRIKNLPGNYVDSALLVKCYINNSSSWKAKVGLKDLVAEHYAPQWSLYSDYEPKDLHDPAFLKYAATDGAATIKLWELIQDMENE